MPGAHKHAQGAGELRIAAATEFARDEAGEENLSCAGEDGEAADGQQGVAEESALNPGQQSHQGRLIDIAPGKMAGAIEVVKLIDEEAVAAAGVEVHRDLDQRENENSNSRAKKPGASRCGAPKG